jgi:hypothetical protein
MDRLQEEFDVTAASCAPTRAVAGGGATKVAIEVVPIVEKKTMFTLVLVMVFVVFVVVTI